MHTLTPHLPVAAFVSETILRLILSALLGGIIGLERELAGKPAGLRTNMFICFGAALYTVLSFRFSEGTLDHNRISAQIIPGIGFIGAGSILRDKGSVVGLTTAATLFVVASIGMAAGGGEYILATFATMLILVGLEALGRIESSFSIKPFVMSYEVIGTDAEKMLSDINSVMEGEHQIMQTIDMGGVDGRHRVVFTVEATRRQHKALMAKMENCVSVASASMKRGPEHE
jgi:putative Mg2+ transporter-C (MgtC) family protein